MTEPSSKPALVVEKKSENARSNLTYVIGILVIALVIGYYTQSIPSNKSDVPQDSISTPPTPTQTPKRVRHPSWSTDNGLIKRQVERVKWSPHLPFAKQLLKLREPTIITNTVAAHWKAIERWGHPEYLASHPALSHMTGVQIGPENTFGFIDNKTSLAKLKLPGINLVPNYIEVNMSSSEFFKRINDVNDDNYYYWYGKVEGDLKKDVSPSDFIWVDAEDKASFGLFMWLSGNDTRPPVHYDQDHNFFVHVAGTKRFVLFPPWEWPKLYPFPRTHPKWHKSQCSFDNPDLERVPNYKDAEAWEAVLNPGEVLYNPPYWWHHVESVTASVSLASWSQSGVYRMLKNIYERNIEVDKEKDPVKQKAMVKAFVELILESVYGKEQVKPFIKTLVESRWNPIKDVFERLESFNDQHFCDFANEFPADQFKNLLKSDIDFIIERMNACQGYEVSINNRDVQAIRDLEICDYIETIISDVVGADNTYKFLVHCLL